MNNIKKRKFSSAEDFFRAYIPDYYREKQLNKLEPLGQKSGSQLAQRLLASFQEASTKQKK